MNSFIPFIFILNSDFGLFCHSKFTLWTDLMGGVSWVTRFTVAANLVATFKVEVNSFEFENYSYVVLFCSILVMILIYRFHFLKQNLCLLPSLNLHLCFLYLISFWNSKRVASDKLFQLNWVQKYFISINFLEFFKRFE